MPNALARRFEYLRPKLVELRRRTWTGVRLALLLGVVGLGVLTFQRVAPPGEAVLGFWSALYVTLQCFALDAPFLPGPGMPGGWALALWVVIFGAPLVTAGALLEGVLTLWWHLDGPEARAAAMRGHVVVCGAGDHGQAVAAGVLASGKRCVLVDTRPASAGLVTVGTEQLPLIQGDATDADVLRLAGTARAEAVYFTTGDALVNLNGALAAAGLTGDTRIYAMVDDAEADRLLLEGFPPEITARIKLLDQFRAAAEELVREFTAPLVRCSESSAPHIAVVGFGRFGQALVNALREAPVAACPLTLTVVDFRAESRAKGLDLPEAWRVLPWQGNAEEWVMDADAPDVVFLCADNDALNLRCAARLRRRSTSVTAVLRMLHAPQLAGGDGSSNPEVRVHLRNVVELFARDFGGRHP